MLSKPFCVFWINTNKHATIHSSLCPNVEKSGRGTSDKAGHWKYEEFDSLEQAEIRWKDLGEHGYPLKECQNKLCRIYRVYVFRPFWSNLHKRSRGFGCVPCLISTNIYS